MRDVIRRWKLTARIEESIRRIAGVHYAPRSPNILSRKDDERTYCNTFRTDTLNHSKQVTVTLLNRVHQGLIPVNNSHVPAPDTQLDTLLIHVKYHLWSYIEILADFG
jgi:hypothetical protein